MKGIKQKLKKIVVIIIVFITIVATLIYVLQKKSTVTQMPVSIANSTPEQDAIDVSVFNPIIITFNERVDSSTIKVTSDPVENWSISQNTPTTIKVDHQLYLRVSTTYKLTVSQNGNTIGTLIFETANEQNDPRQLQQLQSDLDKNYPLASLTPYETPDYKVVYTAPLTLGISIKSSISPQDAISKIKSWVESNGVDPTTHKYIIISTSPTP